MAASEALAIERIGAAEVAGGLALSDAAGWNQTADDWAFFIAEGEAIGVRDDTGRLVASAATLPYEGGVGWIAMVLVDDRASSPRLGIAPDRGMRRDARSLRPRAGARRNAGRRRGLSPQRLRRRLCVRALARRAVAGRWCGRE